MRLSVWASAAILLAAAGTASAGYTSINPTPYGPGEKNIPTILQNVYGGSIIPSGDTNADVNSLSFSNGTLTFTRVEDFGGAIFLNIHSSFPAAGSTDQVWQDGTVNVRAEAVYSGANQSFGWRGATTDHSLFTIGATMNNTPVPTNVVTITTTIDGTGAFELYDDGFYSNESRNSASDSGRTDHMVTYAITEGGASRGFIVFFEDSLNGDYDFNDLAVQLTVVPLPPAGWAGISSLAGVMGLGYIRRRRTTAC